MSPKLQWEVAKQRADEQCKAKGYEFLPEEKEWNGSRTNLRVVCQKHGEFTTQYRSFVRGTGCKQCGVLSMSATKKKNISEVDELLAKEDYKLLSVYESARSDMKLMCPNGHNCALTLRHYQQGSRCQECKLEDGLSGGARNVKLVLEELKLEYDTEYRDEEMKHMPFDFFIIDNNRLIFIEYDGNIHFRGWNGDAKDKENVQARDKKKTEWVKKLNGNIYLIRISKPEKDHIRNTIQMFLNDPAPPKIYLDNAKKYSYLL